MVNAIWGFMILSGVIAAILNGKIEVVTEAALRKPKAYDHLPSFLYESYFSSMVAPLENNTSVKSKKRKPRGLGLKVIVIYLNHQRIAGCLAYQTTL